MINVRCHSHSLTNGKIKRTKHYTAETIDLLAVYDATSDRCYYVPTKELGAWSLDTLPAAHAARNGQRLGTRPAEDYLDP